MYPVTPESPAAEAPGSRVVPLLRTPDTLPSIRRYRPLDPGRQRLEHMVRETFSRSYDACPRTLPRDLLGFEAHGRLLGVTGLRPAVDGELFSEQYLRTPIEACIAASTGTAVHRRHVIEVGNLALSGNGESRWLIAAITAYLHGAGFHWVLFTVVAPLYNAFQRMGLRPVPLAQADPRRLGEAAADWGSYYAQSPRVCFGSVLAGADHLHKVIPRRQARLRVLWERASAAGREYRHDQEALPRAQSR